jgi:hypothetical protein
LALGDPARSNHSDVIMQTLSTILILIATLVNLAPVSGVLSAARLESLYGLPFEGPDLILLMCHRAFLFGIVGSLLWVSAFHPSLRDLAVACGLASMLSFVALALVGGEISPALHRIVVIDSVTSALLIGSWMIDRWVVS